MKEIQLFVLAGGAPQAPQYTHYLRMWCFYIPLGFKLNAILYVTLGPGDQEPKHLSQRPRTGRGGTYVQSHASLTRNGNRDMP